MNEWVNLCGTDGKVKARLNKVTGELVIKERGEYHRWNVIDLCKLLFEQAALLEGQTVKTAY